MNAKINPLYYNNRPYLSDFVLRIAGYTDRQGKRHAKTLSTITVPPVLVLVTNAYIEYLMLVGQKDRAPYFPLDLIKGVLRMGNMWPVTLRHSLRRTSYNFMQRLVDSKQYYERSTSLPGWERSFSFITRSIKEPPYSWQLDYFAPEFSYQRGTV